MERPRVLVAMPREVFAKVSRPGDMDLLRSFAEVVECLFDREPSEGELAELMADVDGCITSWGSPRITEGVLERARRLKIVGHAAGSVKPYLCEEVFRRGIVVVHAAPLIAKSVAEFALALILVCLRDVLGHAEAAREGRWEYREARPRVTRDLRGKTVGVVGFGYVGRELVKLLKPFDVRALVYDPHVGEDVVRAHGAELVPLDELLRESDVVTIHAALTEETYHMIGERELRLMKPTAYLVNTARGAIVDTQALVRALREGWIAGAALDVFEEEPLPRGHPLTELDNVVLTPHVAGPSDERRSTLFRAVVEDLMRFFRGEEPLYRVSYDRLCFMA